MFHSLSVDVHVLRWLRRWAGLQHHGQINNLTLGKWLYPPCCDRRELAPKSQFQDTRSPSPPTRHRRREEQWHSIWIEIVQAECGELAFEAGSLEIGGKVLAYVEGDGLKARRRGMSPKCQYRTLETQVNRSLLVCPKRLASHCNTPMRGTCSSSQWVRGHRR